MDPRDRPRPLPDGATCTACGMPVPVGRTRILARRDDLAFVELDCRACGTATLGLLVPAPAPDGDPVLDVAADLPGVGAGGPLGAGATLRPITDADVEAMRADLAAWDGNLVDWLATHDRPDPGRPVADR